MVSLRRRRLLGLTVGIAEGKPLIDPQYLHSISYESTSEPVQKTNYHVASDESNQLATDTVDKVGPGSSNLSGSESSREQTIKKVSEEIGGRKIKRRKRHRRKKREDQEQIVMRGVYFKNMKWQAAIKVDKKQIHLGTVGSQEEAARLYDRAAFMCGREPNFQLSEEVKQELRQLDWDEFLADTRSAISKKKHQRRAGKEVAARRRPEPMNENSEEGSSAHEDVEAETSVA